MSRMTRSFPSAGQGGAAGSVSRRNSAPGGDVFEHEDVLAGVVVGEEVPAGNDAVMQPHALQHVVAVRDRVQFGGAALFVLERVGLVDPQHNRRRGGALELTFRARYSATSPILAGFAERLDDLPVAEPKRARAGLNRAVDGRDDLVAGTGGCPAGSAAGTPAAVVELGTRSSRPMTTCIASVSLPVALSIRRASAR